MKVKSDTIWVQVQAVLWFKDSYVDYKVVKTATGNFLMYIDEPFTHYNRGYTSFPHCLNDFYELVRARLPSYSKQLDIFSEEV